MPDVVTLTPDAASVRIARRFIAERLAAMDLVDMVETAVLLTSELVTNSVLHARTEMSLSVERLDDEHVRICVRDGSNFAPRRRRHAHDATTGRGIELLDKLAHSWEIGVDEGGGKTIRFVLRANSNPWGDLDSSAPLDAEL